MAREIYVKSKVSSVIDMKIGIFTQPLLDNYGGVLQNYALQQVLISLGHEPFTYDVCYRWPLWKWMLSVSRISAMKAIGRWRDVEYPVRPYKGYIREKRFGQFINRRIQTVEPDYPLTAEVLERYPVDALIVGSDQVWRPKYNKPDSCTPLGNSYLDFAEVRSDIVKISYAASFGVDEWEYTPAQTAVCADLLSKFNAVSVREESGVSLCREYLKCDSAVQMPDPTLLLTADEYRLLFGNGVSRRKPYIFASILDYDAADRANLSALAASMGLGIVYLERGLATPDEWLQLIDDAAFIVTDSFHCTVFSAIFHKRFYLRPSRKRGLSRFDALVEMLGLEKSNHFIADFDEISLKTGISNYAFVDSNLSILRQKGSKWLADTLNK